MANEKQQIGRRRRGGTTSSNMQHSCGNFCSSHFYGRVPTREFYTNCSEFAAQKANRGGQRKAAESEREREECEAGARG